MKQITRAFFSESDLRTAEFWQQHIFNQSSNQIDDLELQVYGLDLREVMLVVTAISLFNHPMADFPNEIKTKIFKSNVDSFEEYYKRFWEAKLILDKPFESISKEELQNHGATIDTILRVQIKHNHYGTTESLSEISSAQIFVFLGEALNFSYVAYTQKKPIHILRMPCDLYIFAALNRQAAMVAVLATENIMYHPGGGCSPTGCAVIAVQLGDHDFIHAFFAIHKTVDSNAFSWLLEYAMDRARAGVLKTLETLLQFAQPNQLDYDLKQTYELPLERAVNSANLELSLDITRLLIKSGANPELLFNRIAHPSNVEYAPWYFRMYIKIMMEQNNSCGLNYNFLLLFLSILEKSVGFELSILRATCELYTAVINSDFAKSNTLLETYPGLSVNLAVKRAPNLAHFIIENQSEVTPDVLKTLTLLLEKHHSNIMVENAEGKLLHEIALMHSNEQIKKILFSPKIDLFQTIFHDSNTGLIDKLLNANYHLSDIVLAEYRTGKERFQIELNSRQFFILFAHELVLLRNLIAADEIILPKRFLKIPDSIIINDPVKNVDHVLYGHFTQGEQANLEKLLVNLQRLNRLLQFNESGNAFTNHKQAAIPVVTSEVAPTMALRLTQQTRITNFFKLKSRHDDDDENNVIQFTKRIKSI